MAKEKKEDKKHEMAEKMGKTIHEHHHFMEQTPARGSDSAMNEGGKCPTCGREYNPQNEAIRSTGNQKSQGDTAMNSGAHDRKPKEKEGSENVR